MKVIKRVPIKPKETYKYFFKSFLLYKIIEKANTSPIKIPTNEPLEPEFNIVQTETTKPVIDIHTNNFELKSKPEYVFLNEELKLIWNSLTINPIEINEIIERYEARYAGFPIVDSTLSPNV